MEGMSMQVDIPEAKAELEAAFARYETALVTNDVAVLDELFWDSESTVRFGATENLFGAAEIAAFRAGRSPAGLSREILRTTITTFGRDFGIASITFRRTGSARTGRQQQSWVRFPEGWRVVAAHVSLLEAPPA
jgi:Protein of unknown function (DUF3225)